MGEGVPEPPLLGAFSSEDCGEASRESLRWMLNEDVIRLETEEPPPMPDPAAFMLCTAALKTDMATPAPATAVAALSSPAKCSALALSLSASINTL